MAIDSKRIAKNTIFLYARLILVLGVTLYTSRVVLDKLGVDDYGLYNVVFSVVGLLSFLNGTLSSGTSRFITFALGEKDDIKLKTTFSTTLYTHLLLAGVILLLAETLGLWYVHNVMVCPPERFNAALIVYQISILITIISILQVPFTSEIMAHEKMGVYAYIGIYEAFAKLAIVYCLTQSSADKLVLYAGLVCAVSLTVFLFYVLYTNNKFHEVRFQVNFNKGIFGSIMKFSGWNIIANISNTLMNQGVIVLFNIFFAPVVVAAQALSNQISHAMMQFVNSVRQAVNPQVIKSYAEEKFEDSKRLTLQSAEYVFDLLLLLGVPMIMVMPNLLDLWLVEVPDYAVEFARLIIIQEILGNFSAAFYTPMVAANKIEKNSIFSAVLAILQFGLLYLLFKCGLGPIWARYIGILFCCIWSFVVKPYILWKDINYTWREMGICIYNCMKVLAAVTAVCVVLYFLIPQTTMLRSLSVGLVSIAVVLLFSYLFMEKSIRDRLMGVILRKLK